MSDSDAPFSSVLSTTPSSTRLDAIVIGLLKEKGRNISRSMARRWIEEGRVLVDGIRAKASTRTAVGAVIDIWPAPVEPAEPEADSSVSLDILFEDEHLIVVDKPAGLVVHPSWGHKTGTLVNGLIALGLLEDSVVDPADPESAMRPGIVHRLDKDTSGLLVIARTGMAREGLKKLFAEREVEKHYRAVVVGRAEDASYDTPFGRHPTNRLKFTSQNPLAEKRAITHVKVQERLSGVTVVCCDIVTGRTHQIRVHLSEGGKTPVLGDMLYGKAPKEPELQAISQQLGRHWLHAEVLSFLHPISKEVMRFESPIPLVLAEVLERLRSRTTDVASRLGMTKR